jgi:hypothetical protein
MEKVSKKMETARQSWKSRDPNLGRADESTNFAMAAAAPAAGKRKRNLSEDDAYLILNNKSVVLILTLPVHRPLPPKFALARVLARRPLNLPACRYTPAMILTALQEVAQHAERRRIDWRALVARTATGITSAREYQMLWRYFAYGHEFDWNVDESAQPLVCTPGLFCQFQLCLLATIMRRTCSGSIFF